MLLCYNICWSLWPPKFCPMSVQSLIYTLKSLLFMPKSLLFTLIYVFLVSIVPVTYSGGSSYNVSSSEPMTAHVQSGDKGGGAHWWRFFTSLHTKLFWHAIYCAKPRTNTKSQYVSWFLRALQRGPLGLMRYFYLVIAMAIQTLTHTCTYGIGSLRFSAMSKLK